MFAYPIHFNREKTKYILITTAGNVSGSGPREAGHLNAPCPDHQVWRRMTVADAQHHTQACVRSN